MGIYILTYTLRYRSRSMAKQHVRCWGGVRTYGRHSEIDEIDPMYGQAVRRKRSWSSWRWAVLHQCIRPLIGARCLRAIMEISTPAISLADRPQRAIRVTSVRKRRENRSSISSHPLADLGGQSGYVRVSSVLRRTIKQAGRLPQQACPPRSCGHGQERSMRCAPACWQARSPAHCGAAASWPPRSRV